MASKLQENEEKIKSEVEILINYTNAIKTHTDYETYLSIAGKEV